jgi:hypothetical protein
MKNIRLISSRDRGGGRRHELELGLLLAAALLSCAVVGASGANGALAAVSEESLAPVQTGSGWTDYDSQPLRVNIWHQKDEGEVYQRGENIRLHFEANQDAYAVVYRIDTEGEVTILWPLSRYDDGFVFGHHQYSLPTAGAERLRASRQEGVEYIEALVSLYPFDLRALEVDFHHEANDQRFAFRIAGDPFLGMNEINFAVTGLEDPADYVVTNYTSYYVHRAVDHPRYLCSQCHDQDLGYDPYDDTCVVHVYHDYGWYNRWYLRFGYYPAYYYPLYYYVDPWSWRPWVNYWYTPWYYWPYGLAYSWPYNYYIWYDSPYYWGDCWSRWRDGQRRYRPLAGVYAARADQREARMRNNSLMVPGAAPSEEIRQAMRTRSVLTDRERIAVKGVRQGADTGARGKYRNTEPTVRTRTKFPAASTTISAPGLRIRDGMGSSPGSASLQRSRADSRSDPQLRLRSGTPQPTVSGKDRKVPSARTGGDRSLRPGSGQDKPRGSIRSVEPRKKGSRIWSGGRTAPSADRKARPGQVEPARPDRRQEPSPSATPKAGRSRSSSRGSSERNPAVRSGSQRSSSGQKPAAVRPSPPSKPSRSSPPPSRSSGSSRSSGGSSRGSDKSRRGGGGR